MLRTGSNQSSQSLLLSKFQFTSVCTVRHRESLCSIVDFTYRKNHVYRQQVLIQWHEFGELITHRIIGWYDHTWRGYGDMITRHMNMVMCWHTTRNWWCYDTSSDLGIWWHIAWIWWYDGTSHEFGNIMTHRMNLVIWWHITWVWWCYDTSRELAIWWHIAWIWRYVDTL